MLGANFGEIIRRIGWRVAFVNPVKSVELVQNGKATTHRITDGKDGVEDFDIVVSNADVHHTYKKLYSLPRSQKSVQRS